MRFALAACFLLAGCATGGQSPLAIHVPPQGINQVFEGPITAAPGHTLILGDLNLPADAPIPRHFHHGEEFIYVLGGSSVLSFASEPEVTLLPGQGLRIPPRTVHWGRAGPDGLRAISSWVKADGKPLRETAE